MKLKKYPQYFSTEPELDNVAIRESYLRRLTKAGYMLSPEDASVSDNDDVVYGVPWL